MISSRIFASHGAFAAVRCDGKCITWGGEDYGGDSSAVQERMLTVAILSHAGQLWLKLLEIQNIW